MRLEAQAKINIGLIVGGKRSDGFHDIETIMVRIPLADIIHAECRASSALSVDIAGNGGYLKSGMDLMEKAARAFSADASIPFSLSLSIEKHIPAESGLGGGSSDAAAVLDYLNAFFSFPLTRQELMKLAGSVGSDVPFFVSGYRSAFVTGRGDIVMERAIPERLRLYLMVPEKGSSTSLSYARIDSIPRPERHLPPPGGPFPTRITHPNDFESTICGIPEWIPDEFIADGIYVSMTGSGSAWFALVPEEWHEKFDNLEKYGIVSPYIIL